MSNKMRGDVKPKKESKIQMEAFSLLGPLVSSGRMKLSIGATHKKTAAVDASRKASGVNAMVSTRMDHWTLSWRSRVPAKKFRWGASRDTSSYPNGLPRRCPPCS